MGKLAEAYVEIGSKTKSFDDGLVSSEKSLMAFVSRANSMLAAVGAGLGTAGLVSFLSDAATAASDLNETISKTGQVFGSASGQVTAFADEMADQFGAVKQVTLDAASMFGLIAQGAGMTAGEAANLSIRLVRLADDASSFFNVPLDAALEKIRAGLVGESEPLRAFGVMLSETAVQQQAFSMGLASTTKDLTEQEKVLARVELITRGLAKAQGDHARTMDGYANQIRKLSGEWQNFKAEIGGPLAGGATQIMSMLRKDGFQKTLDSLFGAMWDTIEGKPNPLQAGADKIAGVQVGGIKAENAAAAKARADMAVFDQFAAAVARDRARREGAAFDAARFGGGGFGAFGPFGQIGQAINAQAMIPAMEKQIRDRAWSGGWGQMGTMEFLRSSQESILRPKDETAKQQLDELKKIREILAKPQPPKKEGVILRGRA